MKQTILITGANGQLGLSIKEVSLKNCEFNFIFKDSSQLDITDLNVVSNFFKDNTIHWCINCAAYTAVDKAEEHQEKSTIVNTQGVKNLAKTCSEFDVDLIHISTDFVFDGSSNKAYKETDQTNPINVYGSTKLEGEKAIYSYCNKYYIIRTSWLYSKYRNNFLKTMLRLADEREEVSVVSDEIGSPTSANDLAKTILEIVKKNNQVYGTYHYCNQGTTSWYNFAATIFEIANKDIKLSPIKSEAYPTLAKRPKFSVLDTTKIKNTFDVNIPQWKTSLKRAIRELDMNNNLQTAIVASLKAGEVIMDVYNTAFNVEIKGDKSPLTEADKQANTIINSFLKPTNIPIISEENRQIDFNTRKLWDTCWIVDPVDGTKEFIKRNGEFTVNIALVSNGKPILGVIYVPAEKTLFFADVHSQTAFKSELKIHDSTIEEVLNNATKLQSKQNNSNAVEVVGSRSHMNQETLDFVESLKQKGKSVEIVSRGSSLKFCLVAQGKADLYPRFAPTMEWDTAAGQAICEAVGVQVISNKTNEPLRYNKENLLNPWFIVSKHK